MIGNSLANQKSLYKKIAQIALQKKKSFPLRARNSGIGHNY